ncbi:hypothetical protein I6A60_09795 [Frankia sp. AgB1.9]|uniref:hypothetical protein n=1 Tax=unclassified Frankia TaxID=2632575 RepID=UPI00193160B0|nr:MULTISPECIES: hypothetical protein [unclassified Frankia]MBL7491026.1 hypothetical protein [Frankia sp. AgW1.1]MBL7548167.1 hypothetical protein [Frankia sp. AgB1.9]MBL7620393.1 hypothetical protein [Frankia sp. AgB1.8]
MSVTTSSQSAGLAPGIVEALDARFQERRQQVPVLAQRAKAEGVEEIRSAEDLVPLLFPHTTYKSYPETIVAKGRWKQLNRWLDSVSTYRVADVDVAGVEDLDGWIARLEEHGHLVSSSSGTSGKASFLNKTRADRAASGQNLLDSLTWLGLPPSREWHVCPVGPDTGISSAIYIRDVFLANYRKADAFPLPESKPVTDHHRYMARLGAMRRAIADGTASPDEVAAFDAEGAARQADVEARLHFLADQIIAHRDENIFFNSMFVLLYRLNEILREKGVKPGDITGLNGLQVAGGLKGMTLPPDYRERIFELLNIQPSRFLHYYAMQEVNLRSVKCLAGRYHVPAGLTLLVLDKNGEALAPLSDGQVEGRAAFFDFSVDGRWGATISGDRILADFRVCSCGREGTTVFEDITRYKDLPDGDKITCAGTMDAYVRGFIES